MCNNWQTFRSPRSEPMSSLRVADDRKGMGLIASVTISCTFEVGVTTPHSRTSCPHRGRCSNCSRLYRGSRWRDAFDPIGRNQRPHLVYIDGWIRRLRISRRAMLAPILPRPIMPICMVTSFTLAPETPVRRSCHHSQYEATNLKAPSKHRPKLSPLLARLNINPRCGGDPPACSDQFCRSPSFLNAPQFGANHLDLDVRVYGVQM